MVADQGDCNGGLPLQSSDFREQSGISSYATGIHGFFFVEPLGKKPTRRTPKNSSTGTSMVRKGTVWWPRTANNKKFKIWKKMH